MTRLKLFAFLMLSSVVFFTACKNDGGLMTSSNDTLQSIPADASMVTKVDVQSIMDKMDFKSVQKMDFYQDALKEVREESEIAATIMADPAASGIDLSKNVYMAYDIDPKVIGNVFSYASISLKDVAAFEAMLKEAGGSTFENKDGYKVFQPRKKQIVAWNDDMAIVGMASSYMDMSGPLADIFATEKANSMAVNKDFQSRLSGKHDVTSWFSTNTLADNPDAKMAVGFMNIKPEALKDNFSYGFVDFKDGAIVSESKFDVHEDLARDLRLFFKDEPKTNFGKLVPGENMGFGMTAAIDLKGINQVLSERPQAKSMTNFSLRKFGIDVDQIVKAFGGDVMIAGYGDKMPSDGAGLFATNIADRDELDALLKAADEFGLLTKVSDDLYDVGSMTGVRNQQVLIHKGVAFVGASATLKKIKSGDFSASDFSKKMKNISADNVFSLVTDFDVFKGDTMKELEKFGGRFIELTSDRDGADFKMEFEDTKTNSLKQIMELMNDLYLKNKGKNGKSI